MSGCRSLRRLLADFASTPHPAPQMANLPADPERDADTTMTSGAMPSASPIPSKKLGQMLVEQGWITGEQLIRAIQSQRVVGGRIGTCLLEMDVLTEDRLLEALSDQLNVPAASIEELRTIDNGILDLIPSKVASRWQAIPFLADDHTVRVATLNVKNLACIDDLGFCSSKRVVPHIANEVRIFEALEKYYRVECPKRYGHLLDRLNRSRYMWDESAKVLLGGGEMEWESTTEDASSNGSSNGQRTRLPDTGRSTQVLGGIPSTEDPEEPQQRVSAITWPTSPARLAADLASGETARHLEPAKSAILSLADIERLLAGQADQKAIGQILIRFLGQSFSRCAIFAVRGNRIRGWLHHGEGFDDSVFRNLQLRLDQPSAFLGLLTGAEFFLGPLAPMPAHRQLASCWGGDLSQQCLMMPIRLRSRLISIIYGDCGARGLQGLDIEQIRKLSEKASIGFELCILRRKLQERISTS